MDRSVVAALTSTTPRLKPRSSAKDLAPLRLAGDVSVYARLAPLRQPLMCSLVRLLLGEWGDRPGGSHTHPVPYRSLKPPRRQWYRWKYGRDSDLEAFSHNPSDGSFATLSRQTIAIPNV